MRGGKTMELTPVDYTQNYTSFKQELDTELNKAADGFVKIGYLLKVARDTDVLSESGYKTVAEFAQVEYGLTKDIVSRYIAINDRYSEGGYAPCLASRFQNFGLAKLAEMLTLPDNIVEAIPEDVTKEEIREIKREYAEEQKVSDIEIFEERAEIEAEKKLKGDEKLPGDYMDEMIKKDISDTVPNNLMKQIIYDFLKENPEEYMKFKNFMLTGADVFEILAPSGSRIITSRIPGQGRCMLSITGPNVPISVVNMRDPNSKEEYTLEQLADYISIFVPEDGDYKYWYQMVFDAEWPIKEEEKKEPESSINTRTKSDFEKTKKKEEKKKASKVTVVKPKEKAAVPKEDVREVEDSVQNSEKNVQESVNNTQPVEENVQEYKDIVSAESEITENEYMEKPESCINTQSEEQFEEVAPAQPNPYENMPTGELEKVFGELYNTMDEEWQMAKRYLRQYVKEPAEQAVRKAMELFDKIKEVVDVLSEREDE